MMSNDLYFIPIIGKALDAPEKESALAEAFMAIERLGQEVKYQESFKQFQWFMNAVAEQAVGQDVQPQLSDVMESVIVELAAGSFDDSQEKEVAMTLVNSQPEWREQYKALCVELEEPCNGPYPIEMSLEKQGNVLQTVSFEAMPAVASIGNIAPGNYTFRLSTGCALWEGELTENDLVWSRAFPGRALDLAADTGETQQEASREISLLDGEVVFLIYPGIENGRMKIALRSSRGQHNV